MTTIYEAAGGAEGMLRLAQAWHARAYADPVVSHAFEHSDHVDRDGARIAAYLTEALGGPPAYSETYGDETHVLRRHAGNGVHPEFDRRGEELFDAAVGDCGYRGKLAKTLKAYFRWANQDMTAYPFSPDDVPDALRIPRWDWDGPVRP